jgi:hypothetical protein
VFVIGEGVGTFLLERKLGLAVEAIRRFLMFHGSISHYRKRIDCSLTLYLALSFKFAFI